MCAGAAWVCGGCAGAETHSQAKGNTEERGREGEWESERERERERDRDRDRDRERARACVWGVPLGGAVRGRGTESGQKQPTRMDILLNIRVGGLVFL